MGDCELGGLVLFGLERSSEVRNNEIWRLELEESVIVMGIGSRND